MQISAVQKLTLLDFPRRTAAIVFTPGCNFRCGYCHNSEFVLPEKIEKIRDSFIPPEAFFNFLDTRKGLLDGVVVTGGEPTLQPDLVDFLTEIREREFETKLDTNGSRPEVVRELIEKKLLDYVALDVKASPENYEKLVGVDVASKISETLEILKNSDVEFEVRTTLVREFHDETEFKKILEFVRGVSKYFLQNFRASGSVLDSAFEKMHGFLPAELEKMKLQAEEFVGHVEIRN